MDKAILLVGGLGSRLKPLTVEEPKCLTEVAGKPILLRTLEFLESHGFKKAVIVIGYLGDRIVKRIGLKLGNMDIEYIVETIPEKANSMHGLWLAREHLKSGALIIEGDCVFEEKILEKIMSEKKSAWVVDKFTEELDGSMSICNEQGRIEEIKIIREKLKEYKKNYFKSCGIVKVDSSLGVKFVEWLREEVERENIGIYYDLVLAKHLHEHPIYICNIAGLKWTEIDNLEDLIKAEKIFQNYKYVVLITDGAADFQYPSLNNQSPLEYANIPTIHYLAQSGKTGIIQTSFKELPVGSIVANLGILGYNPLRYYPNGRASFEAIAQDIYLEENDIAFRCNLIKTSNGKIEDFTSNFIKDDHALEIIDNLETPEWIELYYGQSYRNLLIFRNANFKPSDLICKEPHMNIGKEINSLLIEGKTPEAKKTAEFLNNFMFNSISQIKRINEKINSDANMIWLWSPSSIPSLPSFSIINQISGAVVAGLDFMRGIAVCANLTTKEIRGANGMIDTNLKEKLKFAKNYLKNYDFLYIHINSPDEESHRKSPSTKVLALERIDSEFVKPLFEYLQEKYADRYRFAILPDHYTLLEDGTHADPPVPFLIYGKNVKSDSAKIFSEKEIQKINPIPIKSYEFIKLLLSEKIE